MAHDVARPWTAPEIWGRKQQRSTVLPSLLLIDDLPIRISADGRWLHGDEGLHPKVAVLFSKCLVPKENGEYELQVGHQKAPVLVSDVGFFVRSMRIEKDSEGSLTAVVIKVCDQVEESVDCDSFMMSEDNGLYCRIERHGMSVPCKFAPAQYYELALLANMEEDKAVLAVQGKAYQLNRPFDVSIKKIQ